ncbi:MAG: type II toxin-antitoxin system PemK/MazF family toxin [Bacteroidota bacterium]
MKHGDIWLVDLNPQIGTEPGKIRPVVVVQTDLLNNIHPSTIICPITSEVRPKSDILRIHIKAKKGGLKKNSDILADQIRAIDNKRFITKLDKLTKANLEKLRTNLKIILDLE